MLINLKGNKVVFGEEIIILGVMTVFWTSWRTGESG